MGMFDYIGGYQVKLFYKPIFFYIKKLNVMNINHSGGKLRSFNIGDAVSIQTMYYKYPKDFIIFDYEIENVVIIIKNGKVFEIKNIGNISDKDYLPYIVNRYGERLNIKNAKDFKKLKNDYIFCENNLSEIVIHKFYKKWFLDEYIKEKTFGEYIYCYLNKDRYEKEEIEMLKNKFKEFWLKNRNIEDTYLKWVDNDEIINKSLINKVKEELFEEDEKND